MKNLLIQLCLCLAVVSGFSACNSTPQVMPTPVMYSEPGPDIREVIVAAMKRRSPGWRILSEDQEAGRMRAEINVRGRHTAVIEIHYDGNEVTFHPISSEGLKEKRNDAGEVTIHKSYNTWVANLRADIEDELRLQKM